MMDYRALITAALDSRRRSYSPYSGFRVGAALLTAAGCIYTGCNIESASYSPTNCAERTAFFKAVSEGEREFVAIAVVGGPGEGAGNGPGEGPSEGPSNGAVNGPSEGSEQLADYCPPCGVCRQVMMEFCSPDFLIILAKSVDDYKIYDLATLFPMGFSLEKP